MPGRINLSGTLQAQPATVSDAVSTLLVLVPGVANKRTHLHSLVVNSGANDTITIKFGSTVLYTLRMATNTTAVIPLHPFYIEGGTAEDLTVNKGTGTTPTNATALYTQENVH